ncbi:cell death abnormality protein 1-like [Ostrea edulis]|uniref:cell death abnormality protein 1-like n=1 Tax=Ostrea edulis TaxID=37623 RepID=UPI0024AFA0E8|nr:cell death abnormality protein 1-like [Ostrea edulis]
MYVKKFLKTWYFYLCIRGFFILAANTTEHGDCYDELTGKPRCCSDYRNVSGRCEYCIGSFGENCSQPCSFGFFGYRCKEKCNCSSDTHWCDNISGCKIKVNAYRTWYGYCYDELTEKPICCSGYRNVSGRCEPCLGSFGVACKNICPDGYYGHACKKKCDCLPTESCHKIHGCSVDVNNRTQENRTKHLAFGVVGSIVGTSAAWFLMYLVCSWKRRSNRRMKVTMEGKTFS